MQEYIREKDLKIDQVAIANAINELNLPALPDADFDGESVSSHTGTEGPNANAPKVMEPLFNGIPPHILQHLNRMKAAQNDAKNRKRAADKKLEKNRKAAKAAKVARKKSR